VRFEEYFKVQCHEMVVEMKPWNSRLGLTKEEIKKRHRDKEGRIGLGRRGDQNGHGGTVKEGRIGWAWRYRRGEKYWVKEETKMDKEIQLPRIVDRRRDQKWAWRYRKEENDWVREETRRRDKEKRQGDTATENSA
jgi:hypothetical protein